MTNYDAQAAAAKVLLSQNKSEEALPYLQRALVLLPHQPLDEGLKAKMLEATRKTIEEIEAALDQ